MNNLFRWLAISIALAVSPAMSANQGSVQVPTSGPMSATTFTTNFLNPALLATFTSNWGPSPPANGPGAAPATFQQWMDTSTSPSILKVYDGSSWLPMGAVDAANHAYSLNVLNPVHGSYWSDKSPFTANPIFRVRDRLCVDDGCLIPTDLNGGNATMPNTRAAAAINAAGSNWRQPPIRSSIFALSSTSQVAISGMTNTALTSEVFPSQGSQAAIGVLGMALADHPTNNLPAWGFYGECARIAAPGFCFGTELEVGNTVPGVVRIGPYAGEPMGITIAAHLYSGGALDQTTHTYYPASAAIDIGINNGFNAGFDKGIVFVDQSVTDQGGGVINSINFPTSHRINWFRNNSGDELQAYITGKNTTLGSAVQSIEFGLSNRMTLTAGTVRTLGAHEIISGSGATVATLGIGRTAAEGGLGLVALADQVFAGTIAGDFAVEANTNLWLGANVAGTAKAGIKIDTGGLLTFKQYASVGILQTNASGAVSSSLNVPSGTTALSGFSTTAAAIGIGRTAFEGALVISATANNPFTGAAPGDMVVEANTTLWLAANNAVSSIPGIKISTSGLLTFSQYGAGVLQSSGSGAVSSSLNVPSGLTVLSGASGTVSTLGIGRTATEGGFGVVATNDQVFTGTVAGDLAVEANTNLWLGANVAGTSKAGIKIDTSGLLTFKQYASLGMLQTNASGVVVSSLNVPSGMIALSGASGAFSAFSLGRTAAEGSIGIAAAPDQFAIGAVAGDFGIQAQTNLWLAANGSGTVKSGIKIATTGLLTFSQYGAGVLQTSASGVVSSSATLSNTITFTVAPVFTDASGSRTALGLGTMATQAASAVSITGGSIGSAVTINGATYPTIARGDLLYGSAANTVGALPKNTTATRYLSNSGTSNDPAWAQIDLPTGVTGLLSPANMTLTSPTRQILKSGTAATYTRPTNPTPIQLRIRMVGGGGGGGGSGTGVSGGAGGDGTNTTFSSFTANKGSGAAAGAANAGAGGAATATSGATWGLAGAIGGGAQQGVAGAIVQGGKGGDSPFFSGGIVGGASTPNTGSGGTGGPAIGAVISGAGGGGGAGLEAVINSPTSTYTYTVGVGGSLGAAGTSGNGGLVGSDGIIIVDEIYQ